MASLEFHLDLPQAATSELVIGQLLIKAQPNDAGIKLAATSGSRGHQYFGSWRLKGKGPLPPSRTISPQHYSVSTQRLWLPHVRGVEGSFYAISPFAVQVSGLSRGDFGCHFDANQPGSAGCCALPIQAHWDAFRIAMEGFRSDGMQQVPLLVVYS